MEREDPGKIKHPKTEDDVQEVFGELPTYEELPKIVRLVPRLDTKPLPDKPATPWMRGLHPQ